MPKFTANVHVHGPNGTEFFKEGDSLPDWAIGLVGAHVLDEDQEEGEQIEPAQTVAPPAEEASDESADGDSDGEEEDEDGEETPPPAETPDFTTEAPKRRGPGRPRKSA